MSSPAQKPEITYRDYVRPDARLIVELYRAARLLRPVDDVERIHRMYGGSNLVLTAWHNETLVGVLRGWHDGAYDGYVCDLAVLPDYQHLGVGSCCNEQLTVTPEFNGFYGPRKSLTGIANI